MLRLQREPVASDLIVWQKSMDLVSQVYRTKAFLPSEIYSVGRAETRAAPSVPGNTADGHARSKFLAIAKGSLMENEAFLMIAIRLRYLQKGVADPTRQLITEISKMLIVRRQKLL